MKRSDEFFRPLIARFFEIHFNRNWKRYKLDHFESIQDNETPRINRCFGQITLPKTGGRRAERVIQFYICFGVNGEYYQSYEVVEDPDGDDPEELPPYLLRSAA